MRVTLTDEFFTPSPQDMVDEFWNSNAERQAEILYSLALICKYDFPNFCNQMFSVGEELNGLDDERADILSCLKEMIDQIEKR
jgi:hypothetical protein